MPLVDLHGHTHFSDSARSPEQWLRLLLENGVEFSTISDHDTVAAWKPENLQFPPEVQPTDITEVIDGILKINNPYQPGKALHLFRGIEITTRFDGEPLHLIGLGIRYPDDAYIAETENLRPMRKARVLAMAAELNERGKEDGLYHGIHVDLEEFEQRLGPGHLSRLHLGRYLKEKGYGNPEDTPRDVMKRYLNRYLRTYAQFGETVRETGNAIELVHRLGGLAILPHIDRLPAADLEATIDRLREQGLDGIEVQAVNDYVKKEYVAFASSKDLVISVGRDDHGAMEGKSDKNYLGFSDKDYPITYLRKLLGKLSEKCSVNVMEQVLPSS